MIGRNVVLIDGLFHQAHAQNLGVETKVFLRFGCDCSYVVQSIEFHLNASVWYYIKLFDVKLFSKKKQLLLSQAKFATQHTKLMLLFRC